MTASRTTLWPLLLLLAALSAPALLLAQRPAAHASAPADSVEELFLPLGKPYPSYLWYGNTFTDSRVRCAALPFDSLPDEIHIRLVNSADDFCFPVKGIKTSPYGWRWERPHRGVDIALRTGDPVRCAFNGVVRIARPMGGYGNLIVVRHYNGLETVYGHLSKIGVKPRQIVHAGDTIGLGGSTGHSTGPHRHFEVRFQYETFDPEWLLDFKSYTLRTRKLHLNKTYFGITRPTGRKEPKYKADQSFVKETVRPAPISFSHTVRRGETWNSIAERYRTTAKKLKAQNPDVKRLREGLTIKVQ